MVLLSCAAKPLQFSMQSYATQDVGQPQMVPCVLQHIHLSRSSEDPNTYLVNDMADPLQRSLNCLELTDYLPTHSGAGPTWAPPAGLCNLLQH